MPDEAFWGRVRAGGEFGPWYILVKGIPAASQQDLGAWLAAMSEKEYLRRRQDLEMGESPPSSSKLPTLGFVTGPLYRGTVWIRVVTRDNYEAMKSVLRSIPWKVLHVDGVCQVDFRQETRDTWVLNPLEGDYEATAECEPQAQASINARSRQPGEGQRRLTENGTSGSVCRRSSRVTVASALKRTSLLEDIDAIFEIGSLEGDDEAGNVTEAEIPDLVGELAWPEVDGARHGEKCEARQMLGL
ncbi:hypothetical protein VTK73DRAFT_6573 [Phialemonium thermophilum]|uniref:NusG-like N-terminal domain-containing protein n=1 Tax=Phialemonium thermophilum TaxID=223376 RepID=A0ABR3WJE1_9PEZI